MSSNNNISSTCQEPEQMRKELLSNTETITCVWISTIGSNCLSFKCMDTSMRQFQIKLLFISPLSLGSNDCQAILDTVVMCTTGSLISPVLFRTLFKVLERKYLRVVHPYFDGVQHIGLIFPEPSYTNPMADPFLITATHFNIGVENRIIIAAETAGKVVYQIILNSTYPDYGLCSRACRFTIAALRLLSTGNSVPLTHFLAETVVLRQLCPFLAFEKKEVNILGGISMHTILFSAPQTEHSAYASQEVVNLPNVIKEAANEVYPSHNEDRYVSGMFSDTHSLKSPSPSLELERTLYKDEMGTVDEGYVYGRPLTLRILSEEIDKSLLSPVLKHLLILPKCNYIVNVVDYVGTQENYLILENSDGQLGCDYVKSNFPLSKASIVSIAIDIASGLHFLHKMGLVHNRLGLFNIIIGNARAKIKALEVCFPNPDFIRAWISIQSSIQETYNSIKRNQPDVISKISVPPNESIVDDDCVGQSRREELQACIEKSPSFHYDCIDVALFGIVIWELLSGKVIFSTAEEKITEEQLRNVCILKKENLLLEVSSEEAFQELIALCWNDQPNERPNMHSIVQKLIDIQQGEIHSGEISKEIETELSSIPVGYSSQGILTHQSSNPNVTEFVKVLKDTHAEQIERLPMYRKGVLIDCLDNFKKRYYCADDAMSNNRYKQVISNVRACIMIMNDEEMRSTTNDMWKKISIYSQSKPCINEMRRTEAFYTFGDDVMNELDKGFSQAADVNDVHDIFNALTSPYRGFKSKKVSILTGTHLRLVLSYRHVDTDQRKTFGWQNRQRLSEKSYRTLSNRISRHARSLGARTVSIWTDQHFLKSTGQEKWSNNCLLPYTIYPVLYFEDGENNYDRLWICAEHQLALSGEGIISEVEEMQGIWRKTRNGFSGKLQPIASSLIEATSCLVPMIKDKKTYHLSDRDDIEKWAKTIATFGFWKGVSKLNSFQLDQGDSVFDALIVNQSSDDTWIWRYQLSRFVDGAVLRISDGYTANEDDVEELRSNGLKP